MPRTLKATNIDISRYEALVRKTASMIASEVELDYEDICQRFRIKAWKAIQAFEGKRDVNRVGVDRFVFACITNEKKDILKMVRRNEAFIEDLAPSGADGYENGRITRQEFEAHYLQETHDQAFHGVEEEMPLIPSTLSQLERQIVHFLYLGYDYSEISSALQIARKEVAPLVRGIREKMADWKPSDSEAKPPARPEPSRRSDAASPQAACA
jgi:RNA polymerase sigma factor (sigma-70 family)